MNGGRKRVITYILVGLLGGGVLFWGIHGCSYMPWNRAAGKRHVVITVTRDYGKTILQQEEIELRSGASVMEALCQVAEVDTAYGGGFVASINGLRSDFDSVDGDAQDWFYYVNGILPDVGARDFEVREGDTLWWDYRIWSGEGFNGAVIGQYPSPFTTGYDGRKATCFVVSETKPAGVGSEMERYLKENGAETVVSAGLEDFDFGSRTGPVIVVLSAEDVNKNSWVAERVGEGARSGLFFTVLGGRIRILDRSGEIVGGVDPICALGCTSDGLGDPNPVLIAVHEEPEGSREAVRLLTDDSCELNAHYGAFIDRRGGLDRLPVME